MFRFSMFTVVQLSVGRLVEVWKAVAAVVAIAVNG